jgi:DNA-directed RNA polymerase specialized sigma24 family protein
MLAQEQFDSLLCWLHPDRDRAGQMYEDIRRRLVRIFACRGCQIPEELADETIDRVSMKLTGIADGYVGNPALYFYGVAKRVHLEYLRGKPALPLIAVARDELNNSREAEYECLEKCLDGLEPKDRELVLDYYREDGRARIRHRRKMAMSLGIPVSALRVRAHRIRVNIERRMAVYISKAAG